MDAYEKNTCKEDIITDAISILKAKALKKKKLKEENVVAYLFAKDQVDEVLSYFNNMTINVWKDGDIYCLSRYKQQDFINEEQDKKCKVRL